ncbi:MAG: quaternary amine ABC transporter ATP-binding protein [Bacillota bacterium]
MAQGVSIKNLSVIFGKEKQKKEALELLDSHSPLDIRKKTGATVAVKNVDFEIEEGELFVIVGLSGSGKSSFIRTLNLLNRPATGTIEVGGRSLTDMSKEELREYRRNDVSMVFQHFGLLSHRTVLGNVEYPLEVQKVDKEERRKRSMEAIELVGLGGWEHHMPSQLSGGMRQRVGLARALTNDPELLLMDEPYSALDPLIRREMQNELLKLEDEMDRTILFITHDMNEAFRMGDRIALLKDAELVQLGTPEEFFKNPANQYVKDFIADVDKTRILKVRNIMRKPTAVAHLGDSRKDVLDTVEKNDMQFIYVTDDKRYFKGFITHEKLKKSKAKSIDKLIENDETQIYRNDYLQDAWGKLSSATFDLPVVDGKGRLRGILNHDNVVDALAK